VETNGNVLNIEKQINSIKSHKYFVLKC
jgi:hypothetical protein